MRYINNFESWLKLGQFDKDCKRNKYNIDVRLVIDFLARDGNKKTFISDGSVLLDVENATYRTINEEFLNKFHYKTSWLDDFDG